MAKGDHIEATRPHFWVSPGMSHHGIDLGDGTVVHYANCEGLNTPPKDQHLIVRTNIKAFSRNGEFIKNPSYSFYRDVVKNPIWYNNTRYKDKVVEYADAPELKPDEVVEQALSLLGKGREMYDAVNFNCEHAATFIKKGIPFSQQAEYIIDRGRDPNVVIGHLLLAWLDKKGADIFRFFPSKDGDYIGSVYSCGNEIYWEDYAHQGKPYTLPPQWYVKFTNSDSWSSIDQTQVPYPLKESGVCVKDRGGKYIWRSL